MGVHLDIWHGGRQRAHARRGGFRPVHSLVELPEKAAFVDLSGWKIVRLSIVLLLAVLGWVGIRVLMAEVARLVVGWVS